MERPKMERPKMERPKMERPKMERPKHEFMLRGYQPLTATRVYADAPFKYKFSSRICPQLQERAPVIESINYFLTLFYKFIPNDGYNAPKIRTNIIQPKAGCAITVTVESTRMIPLEQVWNIISSEKDKDIRFTLFSTEIKVKVFN